MRRFRLPRLPCPPACVRAQAHRHAAMAASLGDRHVSGANVVGATVLCSIYANVRSMLMTLRLLGRLKSFTSYCLLKKPNES